jgi:hypothetical protein
MFYFAIALLITAGFAWLGRHMALKRNRNGLLWGLAGALFPPLLLILKFLGNQADRPRANRVNSQEG